MNKQILSVENNVILLHDEKEQLCASIVDFNSASIIDNTLSIFNQIEEIKFFNVYFCNELPVDSNNIICLKRRNGDATIIRVDKLTLVKRFETSDEEKRTQCLSEITKIVGNSVQLENAEDCLLFVFKNSKFKCLYMDQPFEVQKLVKIATLMMVRSQQHF